MKEDTNIKSLRGQNEGQFSARLGAPGAGPQTPGPPASSPLPGPRASFPHQGHSSHRAACPYSHSPLCPGHIAGEKRHYRFLKKMQKRV